MISEKRISRATISRADVQSLRSGDRVAEDLTIVRSSQERRAIRPAVGRAGRVWPGCPREPSSLIQTPCPHPVHEDSTLLSERGPIGSHDISGHTLFSDGCRDQRGFREAAEENDSGAEPTGTRTPGSERSLGETAARPACTGRNRTEVTPRKLAFCASSLSRCTTDACREPSITTRRFWIAPWRFRPAGVLDLATHLFPSCGRCTTGQHSRPDNKRATARNVV